MRYSLIIVILAMLAACSSNQGPAPKKPAGQSESVPKKSVEKEQLANEDEVDAISLALDSAAIKLHKAFKDGEILNARNDFPIHLLLKKIPDGRVDIVFSQLLSARGQKPIKLGKELQRYSLSEKITIQGADRHFWYDANGDVDFFEQDKVFRTFDHPPQADLVLMPISGQIGRRCYIDIVKDRNRLYIYPISE